MEDIKDFISRFIQLEKEVEEMFRERNLELHNDWIDKLLLYGTEDLILGSKKYEPLSMILEMVWDENKDNPVNSRHLYKITEYTNSKYGKIWAFYVSVKDPAESSVRLISNCFLIGKVKNDLKILAVFFPDYDTKKWTFGGGDEDLNNYYQLGIPVKVKRILSPSNDEWSIEEYNKNS